MFRRVQSRGLGFKVYGFDPTRHPSRPGTCNRALWGFYDVPRRLEGVNPKPSQGGDPAAAMLSFTAREASKSSVGVEVRSSIS